MADDVVDRVETLWEIEYIPDESRLYMRVHKTYFKGGDFGRGPFKNSADGSGMSTDWDKYSTPEETRRRANKPPEEYAVISLLVGDVRRVPDQTVHHDPVQGKLVNNIRIPDNRAHSEVRGDKEDPEVRFKLRKICRVEIPLNT